MSYRVELAKTGRAGCTAKACKDAAVKIEKNSLRQGVAIQIKDNTSMVWRHWGCVTPAVINNWLETCDGDMDMVDGYDELDEEHQEIVRRAFEQGHVDDETWNGDPEFNRFNPANPKQGMHAKPPTKKEREAAERAAAEANGETAPPKKAAKKRGRKDDDHADEAPDPPAPKKSRKKVKSEDAADEADEAAAPAKKAGRSKKKVKEEEAEEGDAPEPAAKKSRGRPAKKAAPVKTEEASQDEGDSDAEPPSDEPEPPKTQKRRGRA